MVQAVSSDPILSKMAAEGVTFLQDRIFEAKSVDVARRVFSNAALPKKRLVRKGALPTGEALVNLADF
jgi:hypothetical protein